MSFRGAPPSWSRPTRGAFPRGPFPSRPGGPPHGRKQFLRHDGGRHGAQPDRARDPLRTAWPRTDGRTAAGPDRTPSGPIGCHQAQQEREPTRGRQLPGRTPFPERLLLKGGLSELKSGPSDSPEGRPPKRKALKRKAPRRAGPRDEQVIGRRGPIRHASGPTCRTHRTAWGCFQSKHVRRHGAAHAEGTRKSVSVEGTFPPREAPLRFLCQASSARTYADSTPLSDDRPTSETPRPQAGRVQFRRLHARRGLGGAGGRSHRALVPFSSSALGARCDRVALRHPAGQAARQATRRAPEAVSRLKRSARS